MDFKCWCPERNESEASAKIMSGNVPYTVANEFVRIYCGYEKQPFETLVVAIKSTAGPYAPVFYYSVKAILKPSDVILYDVNVITNPAKYQALETPYRVFKGEF